jgi:hypothetical protein
MTFVGMVLWWVVFGAFLGWVAAWWLGRSSQRLLTEPVIQIVERVVDNPRHIARVAALESEVARIGELEAQAAKASALQARIDELLAAPPRVVEKLVTRTVDRVIEKPVERIVEKVIEKPVDRIVPDTSAIAERDARLRLQRQRVEHLDALAAVLAQRVSQTPRQAPSAAVAPSSPAPSAVEAPDTERALRARIEHLQALAAVQADRLAATRAPSNATGRQA